MILFILGMASLGHIAADFFSQFDWLPNKPLKCNMCISTWLSIVPAMYVWDWKGVLVAAITGITSEILYRIINRI